MESNFSSTQTSDKKISRQRSGSPICESRGLLQTELNDTKSFYQLVINIALSASAFLTFDMILCGPL